MASNEAVKYPASPSEIDLINQVLNDKSISMNALADETGISYPTLRRTLKAGRSITLRELRKIAAATGVRPSELLPADFAATKDAA